MLDVHSLMPLEPFINGLQELVATLLPCARLEVEDCLVPVAFPRCHVQVRPDVVHQKFLGLLKALVDEHCAHISLLRRLAVDMERADNEGAAATSEYWPYGFTSLTVHWSNVSPDHSGDEERAVNGLLRVQMDDLGTFVSVAFAQDPNLTVRPGSTSDKIVVDESHLVVGIVHPLRLLEGCHVPRGIAHEAYTYSHEFLESSKDWSLFVRSLWIWYRYARISANIAEVALEDLYGAGVHHKVVFWTSVCLSPC